MDPVASPFRNRLSGNGKLKVPDTVGVPVMVPHSLPQLPLTPAGNPEKVEPVAVVVA